VEAAYVEAAYVEAASAAHNPELIDKAKTLSALSLVHSMSRSLALPKDQLDSRKRAELVAAI
jgi:hypothetical protein